MSDSIRILVVEDEPIVAADLTSRLRLLGYEVLAAADEGAKALALAEQLWPDLVVMDIRLKGDLDGIEAARQLRDRWHLPVIFLTAYSENATVERAKLAEPLGYLLKPFEDRELKTTIEMAVSKHRSDAELRRSNRLYAALSEVNQAIVRTQSREELLPVICRLLVEHGQFQMAWIGWLDETTRRIQPVAQWGDESGYLRRIVASADDSPEGHGPTGLAVREGQHQIANDFVRQARTAACLDAAATAGFRSSAAFPIRFHGQVLGALNVYAQERDFFQDKEVGLLDAVAVNITFALENLENDAQRRRAEEALRWSEATLRSVFRATPVGLCIMKNRVYQSANDYWCESFGYPEARVIGQTTRMLYENEAEFLRVGQELYAHLQERGVATTETRLCRSDGVFRDVVLTAALLQPEDPSAGTVVAIHDVTERKQAEQALKRSEEKYRELVENANSIILRMDRRGTITFANEFTEKFFGYSGDQLVGRNVVGTIVPRTESTGRNFATMILEIGRRPEAFANNLNENMRADGTRVWVAWTNRPVFNADGEIVEILCIGNDVTERQRLQSQLVQAQKMEAVGQLAGGVAHDFNNILAAILLHLDLLQQEPNLTAKMLKSLGELETEAQRAANLTRQLLLFSRRQVVQKKTLEVDALLGNLLKMLRRVIGEHISLEFKGATQPVWVEADSSMLDQVVLNLVVNARDAMPKGGRVTLMTQCLEIDRARQQRNPEAQVGRFVCLTVSDTGCGMDDDTLKRIFEPFFTTKETGKGTGLGLATVYGIVKQHGGWIEVDSIVGQGTTFRVFLPSCLKTAAENRAAAYKKSVRGGKETILVVEDDQSVLSLAVTVFQHLGYEVLQARNGQQALKVWAEQGTRVDLLLSDMVMPEGLTGLDLAERLRKEKPALKVIIMSGYSLEFVQSGFPTCQHIQYLPKPFDAALLARTVRECLDAKEGGEETGGDQSS